MCQTAMKSFIFIIGLISLHFIISIDSKLVELSHQLSVEIPVYPSVEKFSFTKVFTREQPYWIAANSFCTSEHTGTHLDAPYHFHQTSWKTHEIPLERLVAPAVLINIQERLDHPELFALTLEDLHQWEKNNGLIPDKSVVLLGSGWDRYWTNPKKYIFNDEENSEAVRTPGFSPEAAEWLVKNRNVVGIGVDTATVEVGMPKEALTHRIVSAANVYCLENLAGLSQLPPVGATIYAFPVNIKDGTGAPARIIASVPDETEETPSVLIDSFINFFDTFLS